MLAGLFLGVILVMRLFPETPIARQLHETLVVRPLLLLARAERHHIIFVLVMFAILLAPEAIAVAGSAQLVAFAWDVSLYFDALIVSYAITALSQTKVGWSALRMRFSALRHRRPLRTAARDRAPHPRRERKPADNDEDGHGYALAA